MDVVGLAHARLQHGAHPDGNAGVLADVVNLLGLAQAAEARHFHVDDAAAPQLDGLAGIVGGVDGLVQADGCLHLRLEAPVPDDVIVLERLLDHDEVELVQLP